jgi:hypothetical protein
MLGCLFMMMHSDFEENQEETKKKHIGFLQPQETISVTGHFVQLELPICATGTPHCCNWNSPSLQFNLPIDFNWNSPSLQC